IDPLKVYVTGVTGVMSFNYAKHHGILCVQATADKVVVATAEPYDTEWEKELTRLLRRPIERVVASPLDVSRYLVEFYALSRSVHHASGSAQAAGGSDLANLEQMV